MAPRASSAFSGLMSPASTSQSLFPLRISTRYDALVSGNDIAFCCDVQEGGFYYAKGDHSLRDIRATEWFATNLAKLLDIAVPDCAVLENSNGETFFGSRRIISVAAEFEARDYLLNAQPMAGWLAQHLSRLYALDLFLNNSDRCLRNFLLMQTGLSKVLYAFDFALARLDDLTTDQFPVETSNTIRDGRLLRRFHTFDAAVALNLVDGISGLQQSKIQSILDAMPDDWMANEKRDILSEAWSGENLDIRLSALRSGLIDGKLI